MFFMHQMLYTAVAHLDAICFLRFRHWSYHALRYFLAGLWSILASVTIMSFVVHLVICLTDAKVTKSVWEPFIFNQFESIQVLMSLVVSSY